MQGGTFGKAILLRQLAPDQVRHTRVFRPELQRRRAFLAFEKWIPREKPPLMGDVPGKVLTLLVALALCTFLYVAGRKREEAAT